MSKKPFEKFFVVIHEEIRMNDYSFGSYGWVVCNGEKKIDSLSDQLKKEEEENDDKELKFTLHVFNSYQRMTTFLLKHLNRKWRVL